MRRQLLKKLLTAIINNDLRQVVVCLEKGAPPNGCEDRTKVSPLHFAVLYGRYECAQILVTAGADFLAEDAEGKSPIQLAKEMKSKNIIEFFKKITISGSFFYQ